MNTRTKFTLSIAALSVQVGLLTLSSFWAVSALHSERVHDTADDAARDREVSLSLQNKVAGARQIGSQIDRLNGSHRQNDAAKLVDAKLIPAYEEILKQGESARDEQRRHRTTSAQSAERIAMLGRILVFCFAAFTAALTALLLVIFRKLTGALTEVAGNVARGANRLSGAAQEVNMVSHSLAQGASEQAASLEQTSASAEEINAMVQHNAQNSEQTATLTSTADKLLGEANLKLDQMLVSMKDISDSSEKISKIIRVIDEIAFQTNMLSLNAAVEAARAGEAGMGFAVVAEEVRNLAQRCSQAARDTSALIEESIGHSRTGKLRVDEVAGAMRQVTENSAMVGRLSQDVSTSSSEQARGIEQISKAIAEIQMVTQKNASNAEQGASTGSLMTEEAGHLQESVTQLGALLGMQFAALGVAK